MEPYFIVYLSRSGSTLLSRLLNEYEEICVTTEASLPPEMIGSNNRKPFSLRGYPSVKKYIDYIRKNSRFDSWEICDSDIFCENGTSYDIKTTSDLFLLLLSIYRKKYKPNSKIVVYKGFPALPWEINNILRVFPNAKFIYPYRNPNAIFYSQKKSINPYRKKSFTSNPAEVAHFWNLACKNIVGIDEDTLIRVKYESLIFKKDIVLNSICEFLNVSSLKDLSSSFANRIPTMEGEIHQLVGRDPDKSRINAWKGNLSKKEVNVLNALIYPANLTYGYEGFEPDSISSIISKIFVFKFFLTRNQQRILTLYRNLKSKRFIIGKKIMSKFNF